jgi:hypothetical protein
MVDRNIREERRMRAHRWQTGVASLAVGLTLAGCAGGSASPRTTTAMAVTDVTTVAGAWSGLLELEGGGDRNDFVELTVDRSGAYRASAARTVGLLDAKGTVAVTEGKIRLEGERGARATGTLYGPMASPERALLLEGATPSGRRFSVRLRPAGGS